MLKKIFLGLFLIVLVSSLFYFNKSEVKEDELDLSFLNLDKNTNFYDFSGILKYYSEKKPEFDITNINGERSKRKFDKELKEKLIELLNMPFKISEPKLDIIEENDKGKYIERKVRLLISDSISSQAYILIPKNILEPMPAVIAMHQHGGNYEYGKEEVVGNIGDPDLAYGKELAERGYVVFAMDAPLFGEESAMKAGNSGEKTEVFSAQGLFVLGHSPLGVVVQEDLAGLDYLSSLDFVDKDRIGCIGHSFGGVRCMYLSALDERVKAVVLSNSVANLKFNYETGNTHTWFSILPGIAKYAETNSILALISPRSLLIFYSEKDPIFILYEAEKQIEPLNGLYNKLNKKESFASVKIPGKAHEFPIEYHEQAYEFLDKNLKN